MNDDGNNPEQWAIAYRKLADEVRELRSTIRIKFYGTYLSGIITGLALAFILWVLAGIFP